jgi:hypothetical protein
MAPSALRVSVLHLVAFRSGRNVQADDFGQEQLGVEQGDGGGMTTSVGQLAAWLDLLCCDDAVARHDVHAKLLAPASWRSTALHPM